MTKPPMETSWIKGNERIDDLQLKGLKIIQNPEGFCFGIDAVLLANFCEVKPGETVVDLGTGTGVIPLILAAKSGAGSIHGIELQEAVADMADRSVRMNGLENRIKILHGDLKRAGDHFPGSFADVVTSNPPYMAAGRGIQSGSRAKALSRHEVACTFDQVAETTSMLLRPGGRFYLVHRPHRLVDVLAALRRHRLEPKRMRFIQPRQDRKPNLVLIKSVRDGRPELRFDPSLIVYGPEGRLSEEVKIIYRQTSIDPGP